jgi:hypothetical protein
MVYIYPFGNSMNVEPKLVPLVIDTADVAREELARVLEPYVRLTREGELVLQPAFEDLAARERLIAALLAVRAGELLGLRSAPGASPHEIERLTGMAEGTVRPRRPVTSGCREDRSHNT